METAQKVCKIFFCDIFVKMPTYVLMGFLGLWGQVWNDITTRDVSEGQGGEKIVGQSK